MDQARLEDFEATEEREAKFDDVEKTRRYEMVPHSPRLAISGDQRFTCPARAGKVRCVNFAPSLKASAVTGQLVVRRRRAVPYADRTEAAGKRTAQRKPPRQPATT